jgi:hypothetical protein
LRDTGKTGKEGEEAVERERDGEVVRKTGAGGGEGPVVGRVMKDVDISSDKGVGKEGGGDKEAVEPRGPRVG